MAENRQLTNAKSAKNDELRTPFPSILDKGRGYSWTQNTGQ